MWCLIQNPKLLKVIIDVIPRACPRGARSDQITPQMPRIFSQLRLRPSVFCDIFYVPTVIFVIKRWWTSKRTCLLNIMYYAQHQRSYLPTIQVRRLPYKKEYFLSWRLEVIVLSTQLGSFV